MVVRPDLIIAQLQGVILGVKSEIGIILRNVGVIEIWSGYTNRECLLEERFNGSTPKLNKLDHLSRLAYFSALDCLKNTYGIDSNSRLQAVLDEKNRRIRELEGLISSLVLKTLNP